MKLLLDTHAFIWFVLGDERLPDSARAVIASDDNDILVSAESAWEVSAKYRKGKLPEAEELVREWRDVVRHLGFVELDVGTEHALRAGLLPLANADPFDRMIAAHALAEDAAAVSNERAWDAIGVVRVWD